MTKRALITGITGQDGAYLAELLLEKGYEVHGMKRRSSSFNTDRIDHLYRDPHEPDARMHLHYGDLTDATNLVRVIQTVQPDEIYNLAAQSHVAVSFETPNTPPMPTLLEPCGYSRQYASWVWSSGHAFIKRRPPRCSVRSTKPRSARPHPSIHDLRTG